MFKLFYILKLFVLINLIVNTNSQVCLVNIDCDSSCFNRFNNTIQDLTNIFQKSIYPFKDIGFQFKLNNIRTHPILYLGNNGSSTALQRYNTWINTNHRDNTTCINILFSNINDPDYIGRAYVNGKCSKYNSGIVESNIDINNMHVILSHEIGHLLNLKHDCELNSNNLNELCNVLQGTECVPDHNTYIMYPNIELCSKNGNKLSPCSSKVLSDPLYEISCLQSEEHTTAIYYDTECNFINNTGNRIITLIFIIIGYVIAMSLIVYYIIKIYMPKSTKVFAI